MFQKYSRQSKRRSGIEFVNLFIESIIGMWSLIKKMSSPINRIKSRLMCIRTKRSVTIYQ